MWRFANGLEKVYKKLMSVTDPVTKVLLYCQYDLDAETWLIPPVNELARRMSSLSEEEGRRLGVENAVKIAKIREQLVISHPSKGGNTVESYQSRSYTDFSPHIRQVYKLKT